MAFLPLDTSLLASGSNDKSLKLWDTFVKPPTPPFYEVLAEADRRNLSSFTTLEKLAPHVEDVIELKLFYTAANGAFKHKDISIEERNQFIHDVLEAATTKFRFDQEGHIAANLLRAIEKAKDDGILLDPTEAHRLAHQVQRTGVFADARFTSVVDRLSKLELQVDRYDEEIRATNDRIDEAYAQKIDTSVRKFKKQFLKHLNRM